MVNKWEIYFCNLDPTIGSEQRGTRPVLVISSDCINHNLPVATVIPLTSVETSDKLYASEIELETIITDLPKRSAAMLQQIRTVSHKRLHNICGKITDKDTQESINKALMSYFDLFD